MTLVLALRCRDGVVLASDGQATSDAAGQPTRAAARKLFALDGRVAWGAAGAVGLRQTLAADLDATVRWHASPEALRQRIAARVVPVQRAGVERFVPHPGAQPPELDCLFAWHDGARGRILSVPRTGSDHQFHDRFAAIGSGDIFAAVSIRPFVAAGASELGREQAKLVAYAAVLDAIDIAAVYVGPPVQMSVVDAAGVHVMSREELDAELLDAVELWRIRRREALEPRTDLGEEDGDVIRA